ncbi:MAG: ATP-binding cassette domain-containing protein, partial [Actinomycetota bacterium]
MLVGLIRASKGDARVLGFRPGDKEGLTRVGALIEAPAFYPYLTGRDNLRVVARYCGADDGRCETALDQVGLSAASKRRFKTYSTGMKQRLGIAAALLKQPELLLLDEPSSGLDPQGMVEMRELIRSIAKEERTVLLSSHLLGEVEQVCDRLGIIHRGRLVAEGTLEELRGPGGVVIEATPIERARAVAEAFAGPGAVEVAHDGLRLSIDPARASDVVYRMVEAGVEVHETRKQDRSLEEIFLSLTNEGGSVDS